MALRSLAGGTLFAEAIGVVPPTVLALHGWGRRGSDFSSSLVSFGALAVDLPGFGASPRPESVLGAREYADLLLPVLEEFDRPPIVVGHSFGGRVSVCLAAKYPDLVGKVLVTGAPLVRLAPSSKPPIVYRYVRKLNDRGIVPDATLERMKQKRGSADYRAATGVMRDILVKVVNEEYREELASLPGLNLIWGANDNEVPLAVAVEVARIVEANGGVANLEVVDGVGHMLPTQAPDSLRFAVENLRE